MKGIIFVLITFALSSYLGYCHNHWDFFAVLFLPSVAIVFATKRLKGKKLDNLLATTRSIDPTLSLHEHGSFWIPIVIFGWLALWVGVFSTTWNFSLLITDPLTVVDALKTPVTVFALCIPFTVAVGRFHGSSQRKKSLETAEETKCFKHYFEHKEIFTKHINAYFEKRNPEVDLLELENPTALYAIVFPHSNIKSFSLEQGADTQQAIEEIKENFINAKVNFSRFHGILDAQVDQTENPKEEYKDLLQHLQIHFVELLRGTGLKIKFSNKPTQHDSFYNSPPNFADRIIYEVTDAINEAVYFTGDEESIEKHKIIPDSMRGPNHNQYKETVIQYLTQVKELYRAYQSSLRVM